MDLKTIFESVHFASLMWCLTIPVALMGIDILTGLVHAWASKTFQSTKMRSGLAKKVGEITIILIGMMATYGMAIPDYILTGLCLYISFMEFMSILENLKKLGVPIPGFINATLNNVSDSLKNDDYKTLMAKIASLEAQLQLTEKAEEKNEIQKGD